MLQGDRPFSPFSLSRHASQVPVIARRPRPAMRQPIQRFRRLPRALMSRRLGDSNFARTVTDWSDSGINVGKWGGSGRGNSPL